MKANFVYAQGSEDGYVCFQCFSEIASRGRAVTAPTVAEPPPAKCRKLLSPSRPGRRQQSKKCIAAAVSSAIQQSKYTRAFRQLLACGKAARLAFDAIVARESRRQMSQYVRRQPCQFPVFDSSSSLESFSWSAVINELSSSLPTLFAAVNASMPMKFRKENDQSMFVLCLLVCIFLFHFQEDSRFIESKLVTN